MPAEFKATFDLNRVHQVISNLIGNALKHTPHSGSISLSAAQVKNDIEITVRDTGSGIPPDQHTRIFEKFSQLGNDTRQGLGLGLYIAKWIVEAHGGKIWTQTEPGGGATFKFTLPAA